MRLPVISVAIALASGCAPTVPKPAGPVTYRCDDGRQFALDVAPSGDAAMISISGMNFQLFREPAANGTRFGCGVLTLTREGDTAEVKMDDAQTFRNCRSVLP